MPRRTPRFNIAGPATPARKVVVSDAGQYGSGWRKLRNRRLALEPLCRICSTAGHVTQAVEVDHIKPLALGGTNDWDNTQSICKEHHIEKTREDVKRIRRGY